MPTKVAIISPSGVIEQSQMDLALEKAFTLGISVVFTTNYRAGPQAFLNGHKEERLSELVRAEKTLADALWCARGGVGALELWQDYQKEIYQSHQAVLIGYSDITIYHFLRFYRSGRVGIHGPNFLDLFKAPNFLESLELLIHKKAQKLVYPALKSLNHFLPTAIHGELIPMNLASLQSIVGCFDHSFFQGKILAIEDIKEPPYKIFRMLLQLKNAGILFGVKALILGYFSDDRPEVVRQATILANEFGIPLFDWPIFGHDLPNWPLLFGAKTTISKVNEQFFTLTYDEQHDHTPIERA